MLITSNHIKALPYRVIVKDKVGDAKYLIHLYELDEPHSPIEAIVERLHAEGGDLVVDWSQGWPPPHLHPRH